jgi:hypothetical protein
VAKRGHACLPSQSFLQATMQGALGVLPLPLVGRLPRLFPAGSLLFSLRSEDTRVINYSSTLCCRNSDSHGLGRCPVARPGRVLPQAVLHIDVHGVVLAGAPSDALQTETTLLCASVDRLRLPARPTGWFPAGNPCHDPVQSYLDRLVLLGPSRSHNLLPDGHLCCCIPFLGGRHTLHLLLVRQERAAFIQGPKPCQGCSVLFSQAQSAEQIEELSQKLLQLLTMCEAFIVSNVFQLCAKGCPDMDQVPITLCELLKEAGQIRKCDERGSLLQKILSWIHSGVQLKGLPGLGVPARLFLQTPFQGEQTIPCLAKESGTQLPRSSLLTQLSKLHQVLPAPIPSPIVCTPLEVPSLQQHCKGAAGFTSAKYFTELLIHNSKLGQRIWCCIVKSNPATTAKPGLATQNMWEESSNLSVKSHLMN